MGKIVAIGGGEIGRPGYPVETTKIDKEIIALTGKSRPKLLFIPTASSDSEIYTNAIKRHFGKRLKCRVSVLYLIEKTPKKNEIRRKILSSDIIYVGGGNTLNMMIRWKKLGIDKILKTAYKKGIVLSGLSAGAICWFKYGSSDSRQKSTRDLSLIRVSGLGLVNATLSPHHILEKHRKKGIIKIMKKTPGIAIALDDYAAIEIVDNKYRVITSKDIAKAHKVYTKGKNVYYEPIVSREEFLPLKILLKK